MDFLPRIRAGLLRHPLDTQVLVYDPRDAKVHLLDPTTACVLDLLEEGGRTRDEIASELARRLNVAPNPGFVPLALEELRRAGLFEESGGLSPLVEVSRRDLVRNLALAGAAALLVPAVATLTATRAYAQISIAGGSGSPCASDPQCGPGLICCNGFCASTCNVGTGGACPNGNSQCASNICCDGQCSDVPCGSVAACEACTFDAQCASGDCDGLCGGLGNDTGKLPNGSACTGHGECCSNNCDNPPGPGGGTCA